MNKTEEQRLQEACRMMKEAQERREKERAAAIAERDSYINALYSMDDATVGKAVKAYLTYVKTGALAVTNEDDAVETAHDLIAEALFLDMWEC